MKNLKHEARTIRLTPEEKAAMLARVFTLSKVEGVGAPSTIATPAPSPYVFFNFSFARYVFAPLALLLVAGVGSVSAAQGALPGDLLYPVKVGVTERIESALAASTGQQARVHVKLAERRLEEAATLAARGTLDTATAASLAANFDEHAASAKALATEASQSDPGASAEVSATLDASVPAHGAVLARLGAQSANEDTRKNSQELAARTVARAAWAPAQARAKAAQTFAPPEQAMPFVAPEPGVPEPVSLMVATDTTRERAERQAQELGAHSAALKVRERAEERLKEAREKLEQVEHTIDAALKAQFEAQFSLADEEMARGEVQLGGEAYKEAQAHFAQALKLSLKLETLLKAHRQFDKDLIAPLLELGW